MQLKLIKLDSVDSTNKYAWRLAEKGEREIVAVTARGQKKGYGRRNKNWQSPKDKGVYASFLLRPPNSIDQICFLPVIFALSVTRFLKAAAPQIMPGVKIRWPNDIIVNGRKIAGVLVEARGVNDKVDFVVVGIGMNINSRKDEMPAVATSLYIETAEKSNIDDTSKELLKEVISLYKEFKTANITHLLDEVSLYQNGEKINPKRKDLKGAIELC